MNFLLGHWTQITIAGAWVVSHLRKSIPARGTPQFWRSWAYNVVSGDPPAKSNPPV
jgi:hypothetical protein